MAYGVVAVGAILLVVVRHDGIAAPAPAAGMHAHPGIEGSRPARTRPGRPDIAQMEAGHVVRNVQATRAVAAAG